jgi:GNAT superfamily N-acetyltransferase
MELKNYFGKEIATVIDELGNLRISVFRSFPYLYEGNLAYEKDYLQTYINANDSMLFSIWENGEMVGATTCIPLINETVEVKEPFEKSGLVLEEIFYFGESVLLPPFRGRGIGKLFFNQREKHASSFGTFRSLYFCGVERPPNHPLKPSNYQPLNSFWRSRGYTPTSLVSYFEWQDINEKSPSLKKMIYWKKDL